MAIHPQLLRIDEVLPFDVYVRVRPNQYDILHPAKTPYTAATHSALFRNHIPAVYIRQLHLRDYIQYLFEHIEPVLGLPFMGTATRAEVLHQMLMFYAEDVFSRPAEENIDWYFKVIKLSTHLIMNDPSATGEFILHTATTVYREHTHLVNVGLYALSLANVILPPSERQRLPEFAAAFFLHDIGKGMIPHHISTKQGPLSEAEWVFMKRHPDEGCRILTRLDRTTPEINAIIAQHHERHDGSGYPMGLVGDQIHLYSKICTIADAFDSLTSVRPYRSPVSSFKALSILKNEMSGEFEQQFFSRFVLLFRNK